MRRDPDVNKFFFSCFDLYEEKLEDYEFVIFARLFKASLSLDPIDRRGAGFMPFLEYSCLQGSVHCLYK